MDEKGESLEKYDENRCDGEAAQKPGVMPQGGFPKAKRLKK